MLGAVAPQGIHHAECGDSAPLRIGSGPASEKSTRRHERKVMGTARIAPTPQQRCVACLVTNEVSEPSGHEHCGAETSEPV